MLLKDLYPEILPYKTGMLPVDDIHTLYWEESGNPQGVPVLFLHGGPGAGTSPSGRRFFDPTFYRIILFDQRGSGKSTPLGEIKQNTTTDLIEDIEKLRKHLNVEKWLIFGGSWGSTLSLAYGEHHPEHCLGFILRGIFLCRPCEIHWFLYGMRTIFPEAWEEFCTIIPEEERDDLLTAFYKRLMSSNPDIYMTAARHWSKYEGQCATLLPNPETVASFLEDTVALGLARMEAHYFTNNIFLPDNFLLNNVHKIRHLPAVIVHGRYDIVCPIVTGEDLHQAWPEADYIIVPDAGHSAFEPGIRHHLIDSCDKFREILKT
jgi:proline iminopeptidase